VGGCTLFPSPHRRHHLTRATAHPPRLPACTSYLTPAPLDRLTPPRKTRRRSRRNIHWKEGVVCMDLCTFGAVVSPPFILQTCILQDKCVYRRIILLMNPAGFCVPARYTLSPFCPRDLQTRYPHCLHCSALPAGSANPACWIVLAVLADSLPFCGNRGILPESGILGCGCGCGHGHSVHEEILGILGVRVRESRPVPGRSPYKNPAESRTLSADIPAYSRINNAGCTRAFAAKKQAEAAELSQSQN
jgi:hypothetical protein